jgi:hypothetical protein
MHTVAAVTDFGYIIRCRVGACDSCHYCDQDIVWGTTPRGKPIPLQPWGDSEEVTYTHFAHCRQARGETSVQVKLQLRGVEMPPKIWRQLLLLCHPDKHPGGEVLAAQVTRWLLDQRSRLCEEDR